MRTTLFKEVGYALSKLIHDIDCGEIGLPDIQRPFVWKPAKVRDLFDSMFRGFPVGYLLFWANPSGGARQIGTGQKQAAPRLLIVDGQQRLTSLYAVLRGRPVLNRNYEERRIRIAFRPADATFEVADAAIRRDPEFIADISELWTSGSSSRRFINEFLERLAEHRKAAGRPLTDEKEDRIAENIDRLYDLQSYPFTALELSASVDAEEVSDIFVRINSEGVRLNQADFILTLMSVYWDEGRHALEAFCREARMPAADRVSSYNHFVEPDPDELLRVAVGLGFRRARLRHVYSILRGKDLETGAYSEERRQRQFDVLQEAQADVLDLQHWHDFLKALVWAGYRSGAMVTSKTTVYYCYAFYLIGKRDFGVEARRLRALVGRWFFMASLTRRYTNSPESVMEQDLARLRPLRTAEEFVGLLERIMADALTEDFWSITLPNELATTAAYSPVLFAYYAALNVLDARVLFSHMRVSEMLDPAFDAKRSALERHHLFPRAYLKRMGIEEQAQVNQIANYALVEWSDNSAIADAPPAEYLPFYAGQFSEAELERMARHHGLPRGWEAMPYEGFLEARRGLLAQVTREGYEALERRAREARIAAPASSSLAPEISGTASFEEGPPALGA